MGNGRSKVKMSGESGVAGKKRSKGKTKKGGKEDGAVDFESGSGVAGGQEGASGEYPTPEGDATTAGSDVTRGDDSGLAAAVWQDGMVNAERESGVASFDGEDESGIPSTETPAAEPEPAGVVNAVSNDTNGDVPPSPQADESARYPPRLCHLCKWADFDGYGFNLHAEKDKPGQYIGSVDPDSPAETGGLKENDRIIEVNGENIEAQTHSVVIQKIKAGGERTTMLVVDREADEYYKGRGITVSSSMSNVIVCTTPPRRGETETVTAVMVVAEPVESAAVPEAETVPNGTEVGVEEEAAAPVTDDVAEAVAAMAVDDVGGEGVDVNAYEEVEISPPTQSYDEAQGTASNGINSVAAEPEPEPTPVAAPEPTPVATEPEPEPAVIRSTTTVSNTTPAAADGELNLHLSAAEMKERLRARRKQDPRLQKQSFEAKHKMFERM